MHRTLQVVATVVEEVVGGGGGGDGDDGGDGGDGSGARHNLLCITIAKMQNYGTNPVGAMINCAQATPPLRPHLYLLGPRSTLLCAAMHARVHL